MDDYDDWSKPKLIAACGNRGLDKTGSKQALIDRLEADDVDDDEVDEPATEFALDEPDGKGSLGEGELDDSWPQWVERKVVLMPNQPSNPSVHGFSHVLYKNQLRQALRADGLRVVGGEPEYVGSDGNLLIYRAKVVRR